MASKDQEKILENLISINIDQWLDALGYKADGADAEEESLTGVLGAIVFAYLGKEIK